MTIYDSLVELIGNPLMFDSPVTWVVISAFVFTIFVDFYHVFFSAVLTWFKK